MSKVLIQAYMHQEIGGEFDGVKDFVRQHPEGWTITSVDGKLVHAECVGCHRMIFSGDTYVVWEDELHLCKDCGGPTGPEIPRRKKEDAEAI